MLNDMASRWDSWSKMGLHEDDVRAGKRRPVYLSAHDVCTLQRGMSHVN